MCSCDAPNQWNKPTVMSELLLLLCFVSFLKDHSHAFPWNNPLTPLCITICILWGCPQSAIIVWLRTPEMKFTSPSMKRKGFPLKVHLYWCMWVDYVWIFNAIDLMNPWLMFKIECSTYVKQYWLFCDITDAIWQQIRVILSLTSPTVNPANQSGAKWYNTEPSHRCIWKYLWWNWGGMLSH